MPSKVGAWKLNDLGTFYSSNKSEFLAHARRLLGDPIRAEEVVQEGLLKVILAAPELNSESHAKAYVHRTIENLCMDIFRLEGRRPALVIIDDATAEIERSSIFLEPDLADSLARAEDAAIVRQAISLLSPAERAALVMWEIEERSAGEIARELGIKESAVRHTISRARTSLKRILSTMIVDESRGLTGLDMLSRSYGRAKDLAKKSSKVALSLFLFLIAISGLNSLGSSENSKVPITQDSIDSSKFLPAPMSLKDKKNNVTDFRFPGLNKFGVPTGFTIADSTGGLGPAYFRERVTPSVDSYLSTSQIIKTESGAANVFISQTISLEGEGLSYSPTVSYGKSGEWVPLLVSVSKSETVRLPDGKYLFVANIAVESAVDSPFRITAEANGRDLDVAPSRVLTRLVLDPSKTTVLFQAVYVIESETGA
jgi:RNA polymerase sigma factor (sigma-70 family)